MTNSKITVAENLAFLEHICREGSTTLLTQLESRDDLTLKGRRWYLEELNTLVSRIESSITEVQRIVAISIPIVETIHAERGDVLRDTNLLVENKEKRVTLPIEILQLISSYAYSTLGREDLYKLKQDNCQWGRIALSSARFHFDSRSHVEQNPTRATHLLEYSAPAKLIVSFHEENRPAIDVVLQHSERWSELRILYTCKPQLVPYLLDRTRPFSRLSSLSIGFSDLKFPGIKSLLPNIVQLEIHVSAEDIYSHDWSVLEGSTRLEKVSLEFLGRASIPQERGKSRPVGLPRLRNFGIRHINVGFDFSPLTSVVDALNIDCGLVEHVKFVAPISGSGMYPRGLIMRGTSEALEVLDRKFPSLQSLSLTTATYSRIKKIDWQTFFLAQCTESASSDGHPLFPNMTDLTILFNYSWRGFCSVYDFVISRQASPKAKALQSINLVRDESGKESDDPLGFISMIQMLVPNVFVVQPE